MKSIIAQKRYYYGGKISSFLTEESDSIHGKLTSNSDFATGYTTKSSWEIQIEILKTSLKEFDGYIYLEFSIPRMGRRIDAVLIIESTIFVIEFKVGEQFFPAYAIDQVYDYAIDLSNFHETSQQNTICPILVCTEALEKNLSVISKRVNENVAVPAQSNSKSLIDLIKSGLLISEGPKIDAKKWEDGRYWPTPTIIEAALALYSGHAVEDISRTDDNAINVSKTSETVSSLIDFAKENNKKIICFVTGVPGAGKTLVGLNIATKHFKIEDGTASVFLSGNGPLVAILREALTRDKIKRNKNSKLKKGQVFSEVKLFIQNVHHFRDAYLKDKTAPVDHVAIFDEAQRAWNIEQTSSFMKRKKGLSGFEFSEPEFLISCLDRHNDWAVIVCLVGGGQEINTGEAGISEWFESINRSFKNWEIYTSKRITDEEYAAGKALEILNKNNNVNYRDELHLSVSVRSFRSEKLAEFVKKLLDREVESAKILYESIKSKYPLVLTRDIIKAKNWLKSNSRGSERYGIVVSSQAQRLKPYAIDTRVSIDPVHWFLDDKSDVRSSYYLEDVATEFHVQGLELDWACVSWDADFRFHKNDWETFSFVGSKWNKIKKLERKQYLKNAYRVLLTRARQGLVIFIPTGDLSDHTRLPEFYNETYLYLKKIGIDEI